MLPPGHIAAGYIVAKTIIKIAPYNLSSTESGILALLGMLFAFAPDLDFFYAFFKVGKFRIDNSKANHRKFITHTPVFWMIAGLVVFFLAQTDFTKALGLIIWFSSWTHFILDSEWGIMWLWPFSSRLYPLKAEYYANKYQTELQAPPNESFFQYWVNMVRHYFTEKSSYLEIIIIILALSIALQK